MDNDLKSELLEELGEAIYFSSRWKEAFANHLGIEGSTVRKWINDERPIPDTVMRGMLSLAHDRAELIIRRAESAANQLRREPGYERIIWLYRMSLDYVRPDLYTSKRAWFDIDGQVFCLNENDVVINTRGFEVSLPDGIDVRQLRDAQEKQSSELNDYSE